MPASLESLSIELLNNILSFIQPRSCLCHLALVSRNINTLVTPHLYRDVFLESDCPRGGNRHILPFTLLMLLKPSTASFVRSFTFRGEFQSQESLLMDVDDGEARLPWPDHPERDNILKRLIKQISHSPQEELEWQEQVLPLYAHEDSAIYALFLYPCQICVNWICRLVSLWITSLNALLIGLLALSRPLTSSQCLLSSATFYLADMTIGPTHHTTSLRHAAIYQP